MMIADADSGNLAETLAEQLSIWDLEIDKEDDAMSSSDCAWSIFHRVRTTSSSEGKVLERRDTVARAADDGALETYDENKSFLES